MLRQIREILIYDKLHFAQTSLNYYLMKKFALIASLLALPAIMAAGVVKGRVVEGATSELLPGVTWKTFNANDTIRPITGGSTLADGTFECNLPNAGEYVMKFEYLGMKPHAIPFRLADSESDTDLGIIALQSQNLALQEVVVTGRKSVIESNGEKTTYNITEDPAANNQTVLDMLKKVPMVTVDGQDNIRVNGNSDFKIYVNGNPEPALSENASTIFKVMPASAFKKIEVITEPGAKYDAEGTGGILNLVTETTAKGSSDGYLLTLTGGAGERRAMGNIQAQAKIGKVSLNLGGTYVNDRYNPQKMTMEQTITNASGVTTNSTELKQGMQLVNPQLQFTWEPNGKNYFSASASLTDINSRPRYTSFARFASLNGIGNFNNIQDTEMKFHYMSLSTNAAWKHLFNEKGESLTLRYQYSYGLSSIQLDNVTSPELQPEVKDYSMEYTHTPTHEHTFQADYSHPFSEHHTLDVGVKGIFRRNDSESYTKAGLSPDNMTLIPGNDYNIRQYQDIAAAYGEYSLVYGSFSGKAGFRYEFTHMGIDYLENSARNFSTDFSNYVPNAALAWNFSPASSMRLAYQMRITRPGIQQINPFAMEMIPGIINRGNPELTAERNNSITLTYSNFTPVIGGNIAASWSNSTNQISNISFPEGNNLVSTYANIGVYNRYLVRGFLTWTASRKLRLSLNASIAYTDLNYEAAGERNHGWTPQIGGNLNWEMPLKINFSAYGGWNGRNYTLQGYGPEFYYYGLSLSRNFLRDERLKVSISATNFASPHQTIRIYESSQEFTMRNSTRLAMRDISFSISYTFGNLRSSHSEKVDDIVNDDVQRSSGSTGFGM